MNWVTEEIKKGLERERKERKKKRVEKEENGAGGRCTYSN